MILFPNKVYLIISLTDELSCNYNCWLCNYYCNKKAIPIHNNMTFDAFYFFIVVNSIQRLGITSFNALAIYFTNTGLQFWLQIIFSLSYLQVQHFCYIFTTRFPLNLFDTSLLFVWSLQIKHLLCRDRNLFNFLFKPF